MRQMTMIEGSCLIVMALAALLFTVPFGRPQMWLYPLARQASHAKLNYETRGMAEYETPHFTIKYGPRDADVVKMVAQAAEKAYQPVTQTLSYSPGGKTLVVIYSNKADLNQAFGWSGDQSAMGVYWGGVIQILSPHAWLKEATPEEFVHSGPMVHEFTHLIFDYITNGNYPRWFTEGLAQYVEYRVNHYEWHTSSNSLDRVGYSMAELDDHFDGLVDQSLAYRESLAAVRFIAETYGDIKLHQVINELASGKDIRQAISDTLNMDYVTYESAWKKWASIQMVG
jgi:hypothetical protein